MRFPSIGIVVPSFNQGRFLGQALDSIFRQGYPRLEVVVMDGGSTDESLDVIRSFAPRLAYWQSQPDAGQAAAINEGLRRCQAEVVAWLNSDDFYWRDAFWTLAHAYAAFPGHGLYIGNGLRYDQRRGTHRPFCPRHVALDRRALIEGLDYVLQPSTFFLRSAWEEAGGLDPKLAFCLDWDFVLRVARRRPAVLINEFLAVSREHEETKTSGGSLARALEIDRMVRSHSGGRPTPGSLFYLLEATVGMAEGIAGAEVRGHLGGAMEQLRAQFARDCGNPDGFPERSDPQDRVYLPLALAAPEGGAEVDTAAFPSISVITATLNQARFLGQALDSVLNQGYPRLEMMVFDGGSTDGTADVLDAYKGRLAHRESGPDRGPAHAINKGFARSTGDVLSWLNSDDMLARGALAEVGRAFAEDPELDVVLGNAVYVDEENRLHLADHGTHRTGFYYGEMQPRARIPAYWSYVHSVPQPTVFFRRRLLDSLGHLDESYHFIFDFELFWRFAGKAKFRKLERTQAFYRIHSGAKTSDWDRFLVELYRFSRPWWPHWRSREFRATVRDFVGSYMRRHGVGRRSIRYYALAPLVTLSVVTRIGNPEKWSSWWPARRSSQHGRPPQPTRNADAATPVPPLPVIRGGERRYRSLFCSIIWPRHPGHSGGEIRDFHLVRRLLGISSIEFYAVHGVLPDERQDFLAPFLDAFHTPATARAFRAAGAHPNGPRSRLADRMVRPLRKRGLPVLGPRYHWDASEQIPNILAFRAALQESLERERPDFLFVSPQPNPVALMLHTARLDTRLIMASYDVEAVRMSRFAASERGVAGLALALEARRARRFERENLAIYDGVIAVSESDKRVYVEEHGFSPERVAVIENGVDPDYFAFRPRLPSGPPEVVFVGTLDYLANRQAAWRLLDRIMPLVRRRHPQARLAIVGQSPEPALRARSDGLQNVVTGPVDDVRPYLARASVACVPLVAGAGTKYKVLEAVSAGVPVVCSPLALEGLNLNGDRHVLLGTSDAELAEAIVRLLDDPALAECLAREARQQVERRHSWDAILPGLDDWLGTVRRLPRRGAKA